MTAKLAVVEEEWLSINAVPTRYNSLNLLLINQSQMQKTIEVSLNKKTVFSRDYPASCITPCSFTIGYKSCIASKP